MEIMRFSQVMVLFNLGRDKIRNKIDRRKVGTCVFGLGKMGLPLACAFANAGFNVTGVDVDVETVENVNNGKLWFKEPELEEKLEEALKNKRLTATSNAEYAIDENEFFVCIVPLGLNKEKKPDYSAINNVTHKLSDNLRRGLVVGFETTLPIGTTENMLKPILEKSGLKAGKDFGLYYSPERLMAGHVFSRLRELKKIIGALDDKSIFIASEMYKTICPSGTLAVANPKTAEMIKLAAGIWRDVNIAFANEMAKIADIYDIDIVEVVKAVNSSPRRIMLEPGCGVGGHCIPVYPYFVISNVEDAATTIPLVNAARRTNESMPQYVVKQAARELGKRGKKLEGSKVTVLGLAYRPYVRETSNSPTFAILKLLKDEGAETSVFDPMFSKEEAEKITDTDSGDLDSLVKDADCIIISTMYDEFQGIQGKAKFDSVIVDGRNKLKRLDEEAETGRSAIKGLGR